MNSYQHVKAWRHRTKIKIIEAMGGKCAICGYNKCDSALALHHLNPSQKELSISSVIVNAKAWFIIAQELRKCVLLCHNCHSEVHAELIEIPIDSPKFNEDFVEYLESDYDFCPICGKMKNNKLMFCSKRCASKSTGNLGQKINWNEVDLPLLLKEKTSWTEIGKQLGVSGTAVSARAKRLGLIKDVYMHICYKCGIEFQSAEMFAKYCSRDCFDADRVKLPNLTKEKLEELLLTLPYTKIGEIYNVSDNTIKKYAKKYGLASKNAHVA